MQLSHDPIRMLEAEIADMKERIERETCREAEDLMSRWLHRKEQALAEALEGHRLCA